MISQSNILFVYRSGLGLKQSIVSLAQEAEYGMMKQSVWMSENAISGIFLLFIKFKRR